MRNEKPCSFFFLLPVLVVCGLLSVGFASPVKQSGVTGGLVVQLGCNDPAAIAELRVNEKFLVQGLDTDPTKVSKARETLLSNGVYGPVSVDTFDGSRLPEVDNLVQLLVVENAFDVSQEEMLRVLSPGGIAMIQKGNSWEKIVKPWPGNIDQWNHFLHGPDNNAVAADEVISQPRSIQWIGDPPWGRSHEELASMSAAVTAGGRVFYIADTAPLATIRLNGQWKLFARDAFSGVKLWETDIPIWNDHLRHFRSGPVNLPRRLVAVGDRVFVTLGLAAPVSMLDAATGNTLDVFEGTEYTEELLVDQGVLYLVVGTSETDRRGGGLYRRGEPEPSDFRYITAIDIESGKTLWKEEMDGEEYLLPMTLTVKNDRVYYQSTKGIKQLDALSGKKLWETPRQTVAKRMSFSAPTIVATDDVLLAADRDPAGSKSEQVATKAIEWGVHGWNEKGFARGMRNTLRAYDTKTGKELWSAPCNEEYNAAVDIFVIGQTAWVSGGFTGYDLKTGEVVGTLEWKKTRVSMPHHRCYRNKATTTTILTGRSGVEFVSLEDGWIGNNSWIRGTCQYGIMPANGLLYAPPDACACYNKLKIFGFVAAAPTRDNGDLTTIDGQLLEKGPAFGKIQPMQPAKDDWTMHRANNERSSNVETTIPENLTKYWSAKIGGKLTQPIIVGSQVFVASKDTHSIYSLGALDGTVQWSFTAGGRIDSSPTYYKGSLLFGSADGWVYCLRASDGQLVWRRLVAPGLRTVVSFDQLESAWPVHGSVIVQDDVLYVAAGRNSYLDGGVTLRRLDPATGEEISATPICQIDQETQRQTNGEKGGFDMEGVRPDILSSDGDNIYMKHVAFDLEGNQTSETRPHLFSINSMLEELWFVRSYWMINTTTKAGWGGWASGAAGAPSGRILAFDGEDVYGYGRETVSSAATGHRADHYVLWRQDKNAPSSGKKNAAPNSIWKFDDSLIVRAMALTEDKLVVAGPPDLGKKSSEILAFDNEEEALAGFLGERGVKLRLLAREDGKTLAEYDLDAMPSFDGLSAGHRKLFISLKNGTVECWGEE